MAPTKMVSSSNFNLLDQSWAMHYISILHLNDPAVHLGHGLFSEPSHNKDFLYNIHVSLIPCVTPQLLRGSLANLPAPIDGENLIAPGILFKFVVNV